MHISLNFSRRCGCLLLFWLGLALAAGAADQPRPGVIIDLQSGQPLSEAELLQRLRQVPRVLIGEKHDNPAHHQLEVHLLRQLVDADTAVALEMLDETLAARIPAAAAFADVDQLRQQLQWQDQQRGWLWQDYGAVMAAVLEQGGRLQAGNISRETSMQVYRDGTVAAADTRFSTVTAVQKDVQEPLLELIYSGHCGTVPRARLGPMVTIQLLKDAAVAAALLTDSRRHLLISGAVHARKDIGVPRHLGLRTAEPSLTLLLQEVDDTLASWRDYPQASLAQADYLWFTTAVPAQDYCASLRQH